MNKIFSYAGIMDQLQLKSFDPNGFDRIAFGDDPVEYPQAIGNANFIAQLQAYFPKEIKLANSRYAPGTPEGSSRNQE